MNGQGGTALAKWELEVSEPPLASGVGPRDVGGTDLDNLPGFLVDDRAFGWADNHGCHR